MYLGPAATVEWARTLRAAVDGHPALTSGFARLLALPGFLAIDAVARELEGSGIAVGGQDASDERRGPFTGEVSADDLREIGCEYVEIGHAERRARFGETDGVIAAKVATAVSAGLTPIICVGELDEGEPAVAADFCRAQVRGALAATELSAGVSIAVAYEPIWAIGAPAPAGADHIGVVCRAIEDELSRLAPDATTTVLYGGSAGPGMLAELDPSVGGLFMGRSSHHVQNVVIVLDEARGRMR